MAKGAINLNPGANPTLVQAATKAAMANVPKDLSGTFKAQTENYRKTMESVGASYSKAINAVGTASAKAIETGSTMRDLSNKIGDTNSEFNTNYYKDKIMAIRDEQKSLWNLRDNPLFSDDRKSTRSNIKSKQTELLAEIEQKTSNKEFVTAQLAEGLFDKNTTGTQNITAAQAIALGGKPIEGGDFDGFSAKITSNKYGKGAYNLVGPDGKVVSEISDTGVVTYSGDGADALTIDDAATKALLRPAYDTAVVNLNALDSDARKNGLRGVDLTASKNTIDRDVRQGINESNIAYLQTQNVGNMGGSFMEALNTPSALSLEVFTTLKNIPGLKDTNNIKGIDKGDLATPENQQILNDALNARSKTFDYTVAKEVYTNWYAGGIMKSNSTALRAYNRKNNTVSNTDDKTQIEDRFASIGNTKSLSLSGVFVNKGELENKRTQIKVRRAFPLGDKIQFVPKGDNGWQKIVDDEVAEEYASVSELIKNGLDTNHPGFTSLIMQDENKDGTSDLIQFVNPNLAGSKTENDYFNMITK